MTRISFKTALDRVTWAGVLNVWRAADEMDCFAAGWVNDHLQDFGDDFYGGDDIGPSGAHDSFAALAALATATHRLRLGVMVSPVGMRSPITIAKAAATIDHISNGRFELGLGAGWVEAEHSDYGVPLLAPGARLDRFEEAATIITSLLTEDTTTCVGNYYKYKAATLEPKPIQRRVPIVMGGKGEKRAIPIAARFADHWNFDFEGRNSMPQVFAGKNSLLSEHALRLGRDPASIERSVQIPMVRGVPAAISLGERFVEAGADHIIYFLRPPLDVSDLEELANRLTS